MGTMEPLSSVHADASKMFEITCPTENGEQCLSTLSAIIAKYVNEEAGRAQKSKVGKAVPLDSTSD